MKDRKKGFNPDQYYFGGFELEGGWKTHIQLAKEGYDSCQMWCAYMGIMGEIADEVVPTHEISRYRKHIQARPDTRMTRKRPVRSGSYWDRLYIEAGVRPEMEPQIEPRFFKSARDFGYGKNGKYAIADWRTYLRYMKDVFVKEEERLSKFPEGEWECNEAVAAFSHEVCEVLRRLGDAGPDSPEFLEQAKLGPPKTSLTKAEQRQMCVCGHSRKRHMELKKRSIWNCDITKTQCLACGWGDKPLECPKFERRK